MSTFYKAKFISTTVICTKYHHGSLWALSSGKKGGTSREANKLLSSSEQLWGISYFQGTWRKCEKAG